MNTNNKKAHMPITLRAKKSFLGRIVCRVAGEETGAVMMEYVIVATMIAAAVAVGAWFFGRDILNMFGAAGAATTGDDLQSRQMQANANADSAAGHASAAQANKSRINTNGEAGNADSWTGGNVGE